MAPLGLYGFPDVEIYTLVPGTTHLVITRGESVEEARRAATIYEQLSNCVLVSVSEHSVSVFINGRKREAAKEEK